MNGLPVNIPKVQFSAEQGAFFCSFELSLHNYNLNIEILNLEQRMKQNE